MKAFPLLFVYCFLLHTLTSTAQVPVRDEPRHHNVLENKYIRLLDVWLKAGDTTMYHIHATPSLFVILSNTYTTSQTKGESWIASQNTAGTTWYRSFEPDSMIHRVANIDTVPFHVNDIEIRSAFGNKNKTALSFPIEFENEKAYAYHITDPVVLSKQSINNRGPMIAELVSGSGVYLYDDSKKQLQEILAGKYIYIPPGTSFHFITKTKASINMVLFEIK